MKYKKYELGPYNLHLVKTDRFKTVKMGILFKRKLVKEEIVYRDMLSEILVTTSFDYPTKRELAVRKEDLYCLTTNGSSFMSGNYHIMGFITNFLNEKYTEPGMNLKSLLFAFDLLLKPNVEHNKFNSLIFETVKNKLIDNVSSIKDNPGLYSRYRLLEEIDKKAPFSFAPSDYLKELKKLTEADLYEYYETVLKRDIIDIFVVGDITYPELKKIIIENFKINTIKRPSESHFIEHNKFRKRVKNITEKADFNQSTLMIGLKIDKLTDFESKYVAVVYNYILGGGSDSKLFRTVREKHSYCYSIGSNYNIIDKLLLIRAGIDKANYRHVVKLIKKEIKNIIDGNFTENDIQNVISNYLSACQEMFDSPSSILNNYIGIEYIGSDPLKKRMEDIKKVTKNDIIEFAKKLHLDTIYLLEGENNEENTI